MEPSILIIESAEEYSSVYIVPHTSLPANFSDVLAVFADRSAGKDEMKMAIIREWEAWTVAWKSNVRNRGLHWAWSGSAKDVNITEVVHFSVVF